MDLATTRRNLRSGATPAPTAATRPHPDACPASIRTTTRPDQPCPCTARKDPCSTIRAINEEVTL